LNGSGAARTAGPLAGVRASVTMGEWQWANHGAPRALCIFIFQLEDIFLTIVSVL
jgi:hypothetical protein